MGKPDVNNTTQIAHASQDSGVVVILIMIILYMIFSKEDIRK